jgi:hypothetical protein
VRPSSSTTVSASSEQATATASVSLLSTKVGIARTNLNFSVRVLESPSIRDFENPGSKPMSGDRAKTSHNGPPGQRECEVPRDLPNCRRRTCNRESGAVLAWPQFTPSRMAKPPSMGRPETRHPHNCGSTTLTTLTPRLRSGSLSAVEGSLSKGGAEPFSL